jgi:S-(hydroxymethyl)glutathione dehydrogenase/alcohol dehydrogenase
VITGAGAAINSADLKTGDTVVVIGVGGVGLNAIAGAKLGRRFAYHRDRQPAREGRTRPKFGATDFVNSGERDAVAAVKKSCRAVRTTPSR